MDKSNYTGFNEDLSEQNKTVGEEILDHKLNIVQSIMQQDVERKTNYMKEDFNKELKNLKTKLRIRISSLGLQNSEIELFNELDELINEREKLDNNPEFENLNGITIHTKNFLEKKSELELKIKEIIYELNTIIYDKNHIRKLYNSDPKYLEKILIFHLEEIKVGTEESSKLSMDFIESYFQVKKEEEEKRLKSIREEYIKNQKA